MKTMNDLFLHFLQDIYYAEKAASRSVTKLLRSVENEDVKGFLQATKAHANEPIEHLDRVFEAVGKRPRGKTCDAMNGLLAECQEAIEEGEKGPVLDAAIIACLQGVRTYQVTRYGSLLAFARQMGLEEAMADLEALRDAAREDDEELTRVAEGGVNQGARQEEGEDEEMPEEPEPVKAAPKGRKPAAKKPAGSRKKSA
ncbi:MAG: DUF892 family protein [Pseudomonadota bacterium]|nr:DUF892 family protein [Pseudomonadota bacterium]